MAEGRTRFQEPHPLTPAPLRGSRHDTFKGRGIWSKIQLQIGSTSGLKAGKEFIQTETKDAETFLAYSQGVEEQHLGTLRECPQGSAGED